MTDVDNCNVLIYRDDLGYKIDNHMVIPCIELVDSCNVSNSDCIHLQVSGCKVTGSSVGNSIPFIVAIVKCIAIQNS